VQQVPDEWLNNKGGVAPSEARNVYARFLEMRIAASGIFLKEAQDARKRIV